MNKLLLLLLLASAGQDYPAGNGDRAARNYRAVVAGRVDLRALSTTEQAEVIGLDRQLRRQQARPRTASERCRDRATRAQGTPLTRLDERIIALRCD